MASTYATRERSKTRISEETRTVKIIDEILSAKLADDNKLRIKAESPLEILEEGEVNLKELVNKLISKAIIFQSDMVGVLFTDNEEFLVGYNIRRSRIGIARIDRHNSEGGLEVYRLYKGVRGYYHITTINLPE